MVHERGAVSGADLADLGDADGRVITRRLHQQQARCVHIQIHWVDRLDLPQGRLVDYLHQARFVALAENIDDCGARWLKRVEIRNGCGWRRRRCDELQSDLGDNPEYALGADEQSG